MMADLTSELDYVGTHEWVLVCRDIRRNRTDKRYVYTDIRKAIYYYNALNTDGVRYTKTLWRQSMTDGKRKLVVR